VPDPAKKNDGGEPVPGGETARSLHFIEQMIEADAASGRWGVWTAQNSGTTVACRSGGGGATAAVLAAACARLGKPRVHTRFTPEPNGYLHIGHAKSICLNFGLAKANGGKFNLRFDDTNPAKEEQEYVDSIVRDVKWLGADFDPASGPYGGGLYYASDYFEQMYRFAEELVKKGLAYVCDLTGEEVSARRGKPGVPATSPHRDRSIEESLKLFRAMRAGEFPNGSKTLRAKIDLASPNFNMRDPVLYRIVHEEHHNTGKAWCLYPMYDWAHGIEDSLEEITHSICTLEFENHRPLYDWFIDSINQGRTEDGSGPYGKKIHKPQQIEFAKLRPTYTIMSKRNLLKMVEQKMVSGWDDPRMPTISGVRRRGYPPEAIRHFCRTIGITKVESTNDFALLEASVREVLNRTAPRFMAVLDPIRVVLTNYPADLVEEMEAMNNPEDPAAGSRKVPFSRELYIEREDFMEVPVKGFHRLQPGGEVRLRGVGIVRCNELVKDAAGTVIELHCTLDPDTRSGLPGADRKVKGTIHWVSAAHAIAAEVRLYDRLFSVANPDDDEGGKTYRDHLNPESKRVVQAWLEPSLADAQPEERFQLERLGYFVADRRDHGPGRAVFNRTVTLRDSYAKQK